MLATVPRWADENVLVGFDTADDAGVYRLSPECALVQTVDFFTPIVDDPYTFGAIAAANSLSDVYAMGGRPISALSILAWPAKEDEADLVAILKGGADKMREASCSILGGHSVADDEIKFGYSVTGTVHPERIMANAGARAGDLLMFTKALGTGVISTALKARHRARPGRGGLHPKHAHAESRRVRRDARRRGPRLHRRHRVRPDRPRARDGAGQRGHAGDRRRTPALPARRAGLRPRRRHPRRAEEQSRVRFVRGGVGRFDCA